MLYFWLDKGVDGFRVDANDHLYERFDLSDAPILNTGHMETMGYTRGVEENFNLVYDWRTLLDEYSKKDGKTRCVVYPNQASAVNKNNWGLNDP